MQYLMKHSPSGRLTVHLGASTYHFRACRQQNHWCVTVNGVALRPLEGLANATEALDYLALLSGLYLRPSA